MYLHTLEIILSSSCRILYNGTCIVYLQVMDNGNLIFPPFQASDYKQEVHAQTYRCTAENELGRIQSRDVHVRAGDASTSLSWPHSLSPQLFQ